VNETSKAKQYWGPIEHAATQGRGIDIGCGPDPVSPDARRFDIEDGDANCVSKYVMEKFDFVYSSHCLEHMHDPKITILDWWKLVKPGGYLFIYVPDEDLYEQGVFPSRFNTDHKATFTVSKAHSWSPVSYNVLDLAQSLPGGEIVSLQLQDRRYDRRLMTFGITKPGYFVRILARAYRYLTKLVGEKRLIGIRLMLTIFYPIDQTTEPTLAQTQIQLIVRKQA
jgi:SAM-dependent methyltransferase